MVKIFVWNLDQDSIQLRTTLPPGPLILLPVMPPLASLTHDLGHNLASFPLDLASHFVSSGHYGTRFVILVFKIPCNVFNNKVISHQTACLVTSLCFITVCRTRRLHIIALYILVYYMASSVMHRYHTQDTKCFIETVVQSTIHAYRYQALMMFKRIGL